MLSTVSRKETVECKQAGQPGNSDEEIIVKENLLQSKGMGKTAKIRSDTENPRKKGYIFWGPARYSVDEFRNLLLTDEGHKT